MYHLEDIDKSFTSPDVCNGLGINRVTLQDWILRGFITPAIPAQGTGSKAIFSIDNVFEIGLFQRLMAMGLSRDQASRGTMLLKKAFASRAKIAAPGNWHDNEDMAPCIFLVLCRTGDVFHARILWEGDSLAIDAEIGKFESVYLVNLRDIYAAVHRLAV